MQVHGFGLKTSLETLSLLFIYFFAFLVRSFFIGTFSSRRT